MLIPERFKEYLNLRSTIYRILAHGFYMEPDPEYLHDLKMYVPVFLTYHECFPDHLLKEGITLLEQFLVTAEMDMTEVISEHERRFAILFLSSGSSEGVKSIVPHESVYLSDTGWSMQDQRDEVLASYYAEGVGKTEGFKEPEDHISAELNFISLLSRQTMEALSDSKGQLVRSKLESQLSFLRMHLIQWAHKMCDDLFRASDSGLYKALARLTSGFIAADAMFLEVTLTQEDYYG